MPLQVQTILQSARIAELQMQANELAALVRPAPVVEIPRTRRGTDHRRLLLLLARERRRNVRLVAEFAK
jgi:hypothetical protein